MPPAYALRIAPWMLRFWRACSPARVAASARAQTALMDLSKAELEPFLTATGTLPMLRNEGNLLPLADSVKRIVIIGGHADKVS